MRWIRPRQPTICCRSDGALRRGAFANTASSSRRCRVVAHDLRRAKVAMGKMRESRRPEMATASSDGLPARPSGRSSDCSPQLASCWPTTPVGIIRQPAPHGVLMAADVRDVNRPGFTGGPNPPRIADQEPEDQQEAVLSRVSRTRRSAVCGASPRVPLRGGRAAGAVGEARVLAGQPARLGASGRCLLP